MARVTPQLLAFNRGEVSKIALARVDLAKLQLAADAQVNWLPMVVGPAMLRPGLGYVGGVANDDPAQLIDFVYSKSDTALIELTDSSLRVRINDVLVTRGSVLTAVLDPDFSGTGSHWDTSDTTSGCTATVTGGVATLTCTARSGLSRIKQTLTIDPADEATEHGLHVVISNGPVTLRAGTGPGLSDIIGQTALDTGTHSIPFTPGVASVYLQIDSTDAWEKTLTHVGIEAAGILTLPTPWVTAALSSLRWTQSGDIVYVWQYGGQQYKIERRGVRPGATGWSLVLYRSGNGPFLPAPSIDCTLTPSVNEGNGTLTASRSLFNDGHVGALFRLFAPGQNNQAVLGAAGAFTDPIRVSGVNADRRFLWTVAGTFVGNLTLQRSLVGPDSGYTPVAIQTAAGAFANDDTTLTSPTYSLNNVIAWYRVGFALAADYTSGNATVSFTGASGAYWSTVYGAPSAGGRYGICRITSVLSQLVADIEVLESFASLTPTKSWQESAWSGAQGWPMSGCFHEGRLWQFSGGSLPVVGSQSNNYTGYGQPDRWGNSLGDAGAILESFGEGPSDRVNWGLPLSRLLCGREGSVASIRSSSFDTPLTPNDISVKDCSQQSASRLAAIKVGKRGVFVNRSKVYELAFNGQSADYDDRDLTRTNLDIGQPGFVDSAKAVQPDTVIYLPRTDGLLAALLYDPGDEVEAWWRAMTLGVIENARVLPNANGTDDLVYLVVKRTVNGVTRRFIEKFAQRSECAGGSLSRLLDSHVVYSGSPVTSITLSHLPSTVVSVWADGAYIGTGTTNGSGVLSPLPDGIAHSNIVAGLAGAKVTYSGAATTTMTGLAAYNGIPGEFFADQQPSGRMVHVGTLTPSGGAVTLPNGWQATSIVGFFGFMAPFMSAKLAYGAQHGSALMQKKRIDHIGLALFDASPQGVQFGQRFDKLDPLPDYEDGAQVPAGTVWGQLDQPVIEMPGEWDTDARLCLLGTAPYPAKLAGVVLPLTANEK